MTETAALPAETAPADGSLYGWLHDTAITALIMFFDDGAPDGGPCWSVLAHADVPEAHWPLFTAADWGPDWFREHYPAGHLADLGPLVGDTRNLVFWVPVAEELGSGIIAVKADLPPVPCGYVLPRGCYAHHRALRAGVALPSLDDLLADERRVDLGPRFALVVR